MAVSWRYLLWAFMVNKRYISTEYFITYLRCCDELFSEGLSATFSKVLPESNDGKCCEYYA